MKRGEIYYIDLREDKIVGCEQGGDIRPCVVVQNNEGNTHSSTTIIAMISSNTMKTKLPTHVYIPRRSYLKRDSIILAEQVRTVDKSRIRHKIGELNEEEINKLNRAVAISIGVYGDGVKFD